MGDAWLGDVGIRVSNLEKSIAFYTDLLDLVELQRAADEDSAYVLFKDRRSGQRLELNWYAPSSPFWAPYVRGEGLDHFEVRVKDVPAFLERLRRKGIVSVNREMWVNREALETLRSDPQVQEAMKKEIWTTKSGHRIAYIPDPDGILICLYDHPEEPWEGPIPDHY